MTEPHLSVAIVGAGPAGFYAAGALSKHKDLPVAVDIFDRLPAPYGLVRYGVAPDHENIRNVIRVYRKTLGGDRVRFFGNVEFGKDVTRADLLAHYDRVLYSTGAQADRRLGVPGEDLPGSLSATAFVAWYNGHPDYVDLQPDLSADTAVVVGVGNVGIDVARILARSIDVLRKTDMADYALDVLAESKIKDIHVLGRRGPAQAKFTNPEIRAFEALHEADTIINPKDLELDPDSTALLETDRTAKTNIEILHHLAEHAYTGREKRVHFHFFASPVEIAGDERVESLKYEKNRLETTDSGYQQAVGTGLFHTIPCGLVLRSIGYKGVPLPDVPFHPRWATIPNLAGRITDPETDEVIPREYVAGWAKRGPTGLIGANKTGAVETVGNLLEDVADEGLGLPNKPAPDAIVELLTERDVRFVTSEDWGQIESLEHEEGAAQGRPRVKFTSIDQMLDACKP